MRRYYVYILTNASRTLYVGVTNSLWRRWCQHKLHTREGFTSRYHIDRLVYLETFGDIRAAIRREKQIKGWRRSRKSELIESMNPGWKDLSLLFKEQPTPPQS